MAVDDVIGIPRFFTTFTHHGYRLTFERRKQFCVVAVDVLTETCNAAIDPSCQVRNVNWERIT